MRVVKVVAMVAGNYWRGRYQIQARVQVQLAVAGSWVKGMAGGVERNEL